MIPYSRQSISEQDIEEVIKVLKSEMITQGPVGEKFEKKICLYTSCNYSVLTNSATSALHLACLVLGLGSGDILWTSPNSYVASANVGLFCNAEVDFVDIDPRTYNMCPNALDQKLQKAEMNGKLPKIVMPIHFAGQSCEMASIKKLSEKYNFKIIEDASHAIGGEYNGQRIGSCIFSDITVFSFHPVKIITTGEGGCALTNDPKLFEKLMLLRSHGVTRDQTKIIDNPKEPWVYDQVELGFNYRMTDIQAALGFSQLDRIENFIKKRNLIADRYNQKLKNLNLILPFQSSTCLSSYHLYPIQTENRIQFFNQMQKHRIRVNVHYRPIHTQPYWQKKGFKMGDFPVAEKYYSNAISIPIFYDLTKKEQDKIIRTLELICGN